MNLFSKLPFGKSRNHALKELKLSDSDIKTLESDKLRSNYERLYGILTTKKTGYKEFKKAFQLMNKIADEFSAREEDFKAYSEETMKSLAIISQAKKKKLYDLEIEDIRGWNDKKLDNIKKELEAMLALKGTNHSLLGELERELNMVTNEIKRRDLEKRYPEKDEYY